MLHVKNYLRLPPNLQLVRIVKLLTLHVEVGFRGERVSDNDFLLEGLARAAHECQRIHDLTRSHRRMDVIELVLAGFFVYEYYL